MDANGNSSFVKIKEQFDFGPYPYFPLEQSPEQEIESLFIHNLVTPYYLKYKQLPPQENLIILDAGCGSGYGALTLAWANPNARIVGIDLSENSIELARHRLDYHGLKNWEFHVLPIEQIRALNYQFDYINCDEVIYLSDDPAITLQALGQALKPRGVMRVNFHDQYQRFEQYRGQEFFEWLGLKKSNPEDQAVNSVRMIMQQLEDDVNLKKNCWQPTLGNRLDKLGQEYILMNYLFQCDKGFTPLEVSNYLDFASLELIEMVHWRKWRLTELFTDLDNAPAIIAAVEAMATPWERCYLRDLIHPGERLIDFWCGHPQPTQEMELTEESLIYFHPQLCNDMVKTAWQETLERGQSFVLSNFLKTPAQSSLFQAEVTLDFVTASVLWPLLEMPMQFNQIQARWLHLYPQNWLTENHTHPTIVIEKLKDILFRLEQYLYVMIVSH
ncbi:SAM-dependent methyltransferase [Gloeomargarita lithophora Alchichica-D10]|uniref:SAM-dependent methyltransferase n=1 Tax=Gloeomargarita lithophora Alchichica-D10 TaxID=1188229 RepID=A0A1J0ABM3_9CYAN|nr:class I SAM-dependent methyltransferase [Gloeomargarita lithophora]APB33334.1 SAM-dependent methyltransferase [Gloeomargarita lithophora Alchichica-D10]